jgi:hypothetical protein
MAAQLTSMSDLVSLFQRARRPITAPERWLGRAARARQIAMMLTKTDANVVEAYATECEAEARRLLESQSASVAA